MATQVIRWDPFTGVVTLRDAMDRLFEESFISPRMFTSRDTTGNAQSALPLDMYETEDEIIVRALVPGIKNENLNIQFHDGRLVLDAQMPETKVENAVYHYRELWAGQYHREIALPVPVNTDKIEAVLENGVLTLRVPKAEEIKPKKIQVKVK